MSMQTALLRTLYAGGVLSVALLAPKATRLLPRSDHHRKDLRRRMNVARANLKRNGLIAEDASGRMELTEKGLTSIERVLLRDYKIPEPVSWDGKWRVAMFDIHERRRRKRVELRTLLDHAGFVRVQDSVWVHPYPCDEYLLLLRTHLSLSSGEFRHLTAEALDADKPLRRHFDLE